MTIFAQLEKLDFSGKKVMAVMAHEDSGLGSRESDLKKLCAGAAILPGVTVRICHCWSASVITHDVPDYAAVAGNPAKAVKMLEASKFV